MTEIKILDDVFLTDKGVRIFDYVVEIDFYSGRPLFTLTKGRKVIRERQLSLRGVLFDAIWEKNYAENIFSSGKYDFFYIFDLMNSISRQFNFFGRKLANSFFIRSRYTIWVDFKSESQEPNFMITQSYHPCPRIYYTENWKELISLLNSIRN